MAFKYSLAETVLIEYKRNDMQEYVIGLVTQRRTVISYFYTNRFNMVNQISKTAAFSAPDINTFAIRNNIYTVQDVKGRVNEFREGEILGSLEGIIDYD